ncbi:MAG: hypothetical protein N2111_12385 [Candidatus Sumerlaeaceae bacterium]|nr:hypothetical protein [Candidatus Sumerlaeaceae bacterium]
MFIKVNAAASALHRADAVFFFRGMAVGSTGSREGFGFFSIFVHGEIIMLGFDRNRLWWGEVLKNRGRAEP